MTFDASQDAWTARIEVDGRIVYEEDYAFDVDAALGREVALLKNGWGAERNFPELDLAGVCRRVAERLGILLRTDSWHQWAASVGLSSDEFLRLVGAKRAGGAVPSAGTQVSQAQVLEQLIQEKGISRGAAIAALEEFICTTARKHYGEERRLEARYEPEKGVVELFQPMVIVRQIADEAEALHQIPIDEARKHGLEVDVGEEIVFQVFYREEDRATARAQDLSWGRLLNLRTDGNFIEPLTPDGLREGILKHLGDAQGKR
ncbi:NusA N-terminal domain-containing protein [Myxococcus faecalis]|uniref:NusA N-terminal domain-containing protein n=1 Tax=Myxococcus faecalis TaxID=3115646 RepID=UPI003CF24EA4